MRCLIQNDQQLSADEINFKIISTTRLNVHFTYTQALSCLTESELILRLRNEQFTYQFPYYLYTYTFV